MTTIRHRWDKPVPSNSKKCDSTWSFWRTLSLTVFTPEELVGMLFDCCRKKYHEGHMQVLLASTIHCNTKVMSLRVSFAEVTQFVMWNIGNCTARVVYNRQPVSIWRERERESSERERAMRTNESCHFFLTHKSCSSSQCLTSSHSPLKGLHVARVVLEWYGALCDNHLLKKRRLGEKR